MILPVGFKCLDTLYHSVVQSVKIFFPFGNGGKAMDQREFSSFRQELQKTQKQMADLLGTSLKTIQSFEQGWRKVPVHIERQMFFLLNMRMKKAKNTRPCWEIQNCSVQARQGCPAWEFNAGSFCWFINGTICLGKPQNSWSHKMKVCRKCEVFTKNFGTTALRRISKRRDA